MDETLNFKRRYFMSKLVLIRHKKIWNAIVSDSAFTALIGIDLDDVKPISNEIKINVDQNYDIKNVNVTSTYKDEGHKKNFTMQIDQINQVKKLTVPASILSLIHI